MVVTGAKEGIVVNKVAKLNIENVEIDTPDQSMIQIENTTDITINGKELGTISEKRLLTKTNYTSCFILFYCQSVRTAVKYMNYSIIHADNRS